MNDIQNFIRSLTTEVWAEIYRKRKYVKNPWDRYDPAAEVNYSNLSFVQQDQVVRELYRKMVDYISEVNDFFNSYLL